MFDGTHMDGGWWAVMVVVWFVLLATIVWAGAMLARGDAERSAPHEPTPQERLDRRLADGEIDVETYDELSRRLRHDHDAAGWPR